MPHKGKRATFITYYMQSRSEINKKSQKDNFDCGWLRWMAIDAAASLKLRISKKRSQNNNNNNNNA